MRLEREAFFLIAQIKQVGDRTLERIMIKKNIDYANLHPRNRPATDSAVGRETSKRQNDILTLLNPKATES